mgnify:CR=1 FL=1
MCYVAHLVLFVPLGFSHHGRKSSRQRFKGLKVSKTIWFELEFFVTIQFKRFCGLVWFVSSLNFFKQFEFKTLEPLPIAIYSSKSFMLREISKATRSISVKMKQNRRFSEHVITLKMKKKNKIELSHFLFIVF